VSDNDHNLCLLTEEGEADKIQTWRETPLPLSSSSAWAEERDEET
jgi:hypothetical protein